MALTALVILAIAIVVVLIVIGIGFAMRQRSRLRPLPPESRDRYARSWREIESRFDKNPAAAVQEADRIGVLILSERGATIHDARLVPDHLREARQAAASNSGVEGLRLAMLHYRLIVDDALGVIRSSREGTRPEVAS
jgi:hypothetical protein